MMFVPAVLAAYQLMPSRWRWGVLLSASIFLTRRCAGTAYQVVAWIVRKPGLLRAQPQNFRRKPLGSEERTYFMGQLWRAQAANAGSIRYLRAIFDWDRAPGFEIADRKGMDWLTPRKVWSYHTPQAALSAYIDAFFLGWRTGASTSVVSARPRVFSWASSVVDIDPAGDLLSGTRQTLSSFNWPKVRNGQGGLYFRWGFFKKVAVANRANASRIYRLLRPAAAGDSGLEPAAATLLVYALQTLGRLLRYIDAGFRGSSDVQYPAY